jgi:asparagine synthase (glutamine-hydrolysing)
LLEDWSIRNYGAALLPDLTAKRLRIRTRKQLLGLPFAEASFRHEFTDETVCEKPVIGSLEDLLMYNSFRFGLEELLRYADRNSMAHSLEVRLPFLFHELAEFVFSLPSHFKIRNGFTKWILRESMNALLPSSIVWRKNKIGFEPPQQEWLQEEALNHMILDARQSLVDARILDRKILNTPVEATAAHDAFAYDWRFLNVATILGKAL